MTRGSRLILAALLVASCGGPAASSPPPEPSALPRVAARTAEPRRPAPAATFTYDETANRYGVTIIGQGNGRADGLDLAGPYTLVWETSDRTCALEAHLEFSDGGRVFDTFAPPSRSGTGTTVVRPATYVLAVTSACGWSFTLTPD